MDPIQSTYGDPRKYLRLVFEVEVEVTDPIQAAAYTMDWGHDESGEPVMMGYGNQNRQMGAAVSQALVQGLSEAGPRAGFKLLTTSLIPRRINDHGEYSELTLPSMPARQDDGSLE